MDLSFCMPAYNEEANIAAMVERCARAIADAGIAGEIVVCDDCSRDRTGAILAELQGRYPHLVVVSHTGQNQGYGRALRDAIQASTGTWIATIDSDGQFAPEEIGLFLGAQRATGNELVVGYRHRKQDSLPRVLADRGLNWLVFLMFGVSVRDCNCAYKLVRGDLLRAMRVESNGYSNPTETLLKLHFRGVPFTQVQVTHAKREGGASSLKFFKTAWNF
ncbi:MAG TPA: glycosyltransferase family 2 protein, partial [bacterium]|nr:glycosyltransferase family 2 protein [bacterium]